MWINKFRHDIEPDLANFRTQISNWAINTHKYHLLIDESVTESMESNTTDDLKILKETLHLAENPLESHFDIIIPKEKNHHSTTTNTLEQYTLLQDPEWRREQAHLYPDIQKLLFCLNQPFKPPIIPQPSSPNPKPILPKRHDSILDIVPLEIARQLTLIEEQLFHKITINEYLYWVKDANRSPNICSYNFWQQSLMNWMKLEILTRFKSKKRERVIRHLIEVMKHLEEMKNYNSVLCIGSVLTSSPISELKKTWEHLKKESVEIDKLISNSED